MMLGCFLGGCFFKITLMCSFAKAVLSSIFYQVLFKVFLLSLHMTLNKQNIFSSSILTRYFVAHCWKWGLWKWLKCFFLCTQRNSLFCINMYVVTISGPKSLNKMSDLFKNVFWYIIREMCHEKILPGLCTFFIPNHFKIEKVCDEAVACSPCMLGYIPDQYKTQEMCDKCGQLKSFL